MPKREDFLQRLASNLPDSEREQVVYSEMRELVEVQHQILGLISALLTELDLVSDASAAPLRNALKTHQGASHVAATAQEDLRKG